MGKQTVGYRYGMELHFGLSHPVDALLEIRVADRTAWSGEITSNTTITINKPDLLGGDEKEGGIVGDADVMFGRDNQVPNSYLQSLFTGLMPAFRGMMGVLWKGGQVTANNPYIKPWSFKVRRINEGWGLGDPTTGFLYGTSQLHPWLQEPGQVDPRNCLNDHEYFALVVPGSTWGTFDHARAQLEAYYGYPIINTLIGYNANDPHVNGYGIDVPPGENEQITLHYLFGVPAASLDMRTTGNVNSNMLDMVTTGLVDLEQAFFWNGHQDYGSFGQFPGMYYIHQFSNTTAVKPPEFLLSGSVNNAYFGTEIGWVNIDFYGTLRINCRRKLRPPDDPCNPMCTPPWPDYEPDPTFCDIDGTLVKKLTWTQATGTFKVLSIYLKYSNNTIREYPNAPALPLGDEHYNDEAYWTGLYNTAVSAGRMRTGYTYSPDGRGIGDVYPRVWPQAPGSLVYKSSETVTIEPDIWEPDFARIGDDMNPSHILYQLHTNGDWAMGWPRALMGDSFATAAETLYNEGFGLSLFWTQQEKIDVFCQIVLDHIAGVIYPNRRTGQFELKLIRDDYDPDALEEFDTSNILEMQSFQRGGYGETVNEVIVIYTNPVTGKDIATPPGQDMANIRAQGGAIITRKIHYPGITSAELALRVRDRELVAGSTPLAKGRITVDRSAWAVVAGDVRKFTWPPLGISGLAVRILDVKYGTLTDGAITVDFSEDVWGLPENSFGVQQPSEWVDPYTDPEPAANRIVTEASYYELQQRLSAADLDYLPEEAGFLSTAASRPSTDSFDYEIDTDSGSGYIEGGRGDFCASAELIEELGLPNNSGLNSIPITDLVDGHLIDVGTFAQVGTEIMRVDAFNSTTLFVTLGRGVLDTVAVTHEAGSRLYFLGGFTATDAVQRLEGEELDVKLLTRNIQSELELAAAPADTVTFEGRQFRPYPPGRPRINTELYPASIVGEALTFAWAHRDRLQQNLEGEETGSIGPEVGTTYTLRLIDDDTETELYLAEGITDDTHVVSPSISGTYTLRSELSSWRDGVESLQKQIHIFTYVNGNYRSLEEDGFNRITEMGLDRILEA